MYEEEIKKKIIEYALTERMSFVCSGEDAITYDLQDGKYYNVTLTVQFCSEGLIDAIKRYTGVYPTIYGNSDETVTLHIHIPPQHEPRL